MEENNKVKKQSNFLMIMKRLSKRKTAMFGLVLIILLVLMALLSPWIMPYPYEEMNVIEAFQSPSAAHPFGTDNLGRDILSRLMYGARYSLLIGFGAAILSHLLGMALGAVAGFFGGQIDNIMMRICDVFQSIPSLILNIVLVCALGDGMDKTILALGLSATPNIARIMRSSILSIPCRGIALWCMMKECQSGQAGKSGLETICQCYFRIHDGFNLPEAVEQGIWSISDPE